MRLKQLYNLPQKNISNQKKYLYIWLDILGFSDILNQEDQYKNLIALLKYYRSKFETNAIKTLTISDGIVLVFELTDIESLSEIFIVISKIQEEFILEKEYFLRGGIAVGSIEETEKDSDLKYLVSSALSKAYNLESKDIKYPIIGTSEDELKKINKYFNITNEDLEQFGLLKCYSNDSTGKKYVYFIDFLNDRKFEDIIRNNLKEYQSSPKVLEKYIWLYRYYNDKFSAEEDKKLGGILL
jgi:hypothetical protein